MILLILDWSTRVKVSVTREITFSVVLHIIIHFHINIHSIQFFLHFYQIHSNNNLNHYYIFYTFFTLHHLFFSSSIFITQIRHRGSFFITFFYLFKPKILFENYLLDFERSRENKKNLISLKTFLLLFILNGSELVGWCDGATSVLLLFIWE